MKPALPSPPIAPRSSSPASMSPGRPDDRASCSPRASCSVLGGVLSSHLGPTPYRVRDRPAHSPEGGAVALTANLLTQAVPTVDADADELIARYVRPHPI